MGDHLFGIIDMAVVGVAVVVLAVWQLRSINREIGKDRKPPDAP